eukprot:m.8378 g.8378  ORF g.8378 m.8378 type:complete len:152 (-) comp6090_c0_seq1:52-507(-)
MDHYTKGPTTQSNDIVDEKAFNFCVKSGTKIKKAVDILTSKLTDVCNRSEVSCCVWVSDTLMGVLLTTETSRDVYIIGSGRSVTKAVSIAEIFKRTFSPKDGKVLEQHNEIFYSRVVETYVPKEGEEDLLDNLNVERKVPAMRIRFRAKLN